MEMARYDWTKEEPEYLLHVIKEKNITAHYGL